MSSYYQDLDSLYQSMDEKYTDDEIDFAAEVLKEFLTVMFYEGYSHRAVINFMDNVESYDDIVEKINSSNIVEGAVPEEYIEEELAYLVERAWFRGAIQGLGNIIKRLKPKNAKQLQLPLRSQGGMRPANTPIRNAVDDAAATLKNAGKNIKNTVKNNPKASLAGAAGAGALIGATTANLMNKSDDKSSDKESDKESSTDTEGTTTGVATPTTRTNKDGSNVTRKGKNNRGDTPMMQWARNFPKLAVRVKPGSAGYDEIQKVIKSTKKEAYDYVLDYLFETGQAETIAEANHIMLGMDDNSVYSIIKEKDQV